MTGLHLEALNPGALFENSLNNFYGHRNNNERERWLISLIRKDKSIRSIIY